MSEANDFYEDDEPIEDILVGWEAGERGVTAPRVAGAYESPTFNDATLRFWRTKGVPPELSGRHNRTK